MLSLARSARPGLAAAVAVVALASCGGQAPPTAPHPLPNAPLPVQPSVWLSRAPVGHVTARVRLTGGPTSVAYARGSVWVTHDDGHLWRINPHTKRIVRTARTGRFPVSIAFSPGAVWIANSADDTVSRLDPRTGRRVATVKVGSSPTFAAADGRFAWVLNNGSDTVTQIDAFTNQAVGSIHVGPRSYRLAAGGGAVWVQSYPGRAVYRIEPHR